MECNSYLYELLIIHKKKKVLRTHPSGHDDPTTSNAAAIATSSMQEERKLKRIRPLLSPSFISCSALICTTRLCYFPVAFMVSAFISHIDLPHHLWFLSCCLFLYTHQHPVVCQLPHQSSSFCAYLNS